jgi:pimeloyl-ACP methyl ester carboxylesterase
MRSTLFTIFLGGALASSVSAAAAELVADRISVTVMGKGPDVVLIPGAACSSAVWDGTAKHLEGSYRLHIIQVAGFAGSPPGANAQGPITQPTVNAIHAYIKANKLKAPGVIGHSLGGLMGLMLAVQHPHDVGRLMIVDELPFFAVLTGVTNMAEAKSRAVAWRDNILAETQDTYARNETNVIRTLSKSPEGCQEATAWTVATDKSILARITYEVMTTDMRPELHKIKAPVTILYPWDASKHISQAACDKLYGDNYAALPNKKLVRIDGSYHFIMLDQPDAFAAQVDAFLK